MRIVYWSSAWCSADLGRLDASRLGAFREREPLLEHRDGRVLQARLGHGVRYARGTPGDLLGAFVCVSRGQVEGFGSRAMLAAPGAAAHRLRRGMPALRLAAMETRRLLHHLIRSKPKQPHRPMPPFLTDRKSTRLKPSH